MRRVLYAFVGLLLATGISFAEGGQDDDDEKPGSRAKTSAKASKADALEESDTPSQKDEDKPTSTGTPIDKKGDAPLNLTDKDKPDAREGTYAGVSIGGSNLPPKAPKLPLKGGGQRMTWPGFQVRDGIPTVFLQTTSAPDYAVKESAGALTVTLRGTSIKLRNNQRPLKVAEFGTDITEISARPHGRDVVVTIKRKGEGAHRERVESSAGGFSMLVVELPGK